MFSTKFIAEEDYDNFAGVYEDFRLKAKCEYNFELEPLDYDGFLDAVEKNLIECIVLYDNHIPSGFLVYTTAISEAVELNIIHCIQKDKYLEHSNKLLEKFLSETQTQRRNKIVCYPMLGEQKSLIGVIAKLGFQFVGTEVLRFKMDSSESKDLFSRARIVNLPQGYEVTNWHSMYFEDAVQIILEAFKDSSDALFDPRFKTESGCRDILTKIVRNIYADFLPDATSILLYNGRPAGFVFMNITDGRIVNIPLVGIKEEHQGKGLSTIMLKHSMDVILDKAKAGMISEVNTTTETNNLQALRLYKNLGFLEDYSYPQAYLPIL